MVCTDVVVQVMMHVDVVVQVMMRVDVSEAVDVFTVCVDVNKVFVVTSAQEVADGS